jgi:hypothetical protein
MFEWEETSGTGLFVRDFLPDDCGEPPEAA